ncbi:hypothetical protein EV421DRAFT_1738187 [Armillaria borealis]|uniref:Uncharacterized protein n=1 Tax=Armillaria borealis TaxID=47425 RepID=A0AA39JA50_9AGAR|nr:hypothetical protein EV421DRAFT_1738187 [Armillaria borealis]
MSSTRPSLVVVDGLVDSREPVPRPFGSISFHLFKTQYQYEVFSVSGPASDDNEWDILKWLPLSFKLVPGTRSGDSKFVSKRCKHGWCSSPAFLDSDGLDTINDDLAVLSNQAGWIDAGTLDTGTVQPRQSSDDSCLMGSPSTCILFACALFQVSYDRTSIGFYISGLFRAATTIFVSYFAVVVAPYPAPMLRRSMKAPKIEGWHYNAFAGVVLRQRVHGRDLEKAYCDIRVH